MVINSAHLLGQTAAVDDRLLPLFWALDTFKNSQAQDVKEGDWTLGKVDEARLPGPGAGEGRVRPGDGGLGRRRGRRRRRRALPLARARPRRWSRSGGMAVRDQRNIGHKAIFAAQSWRTLQAIGWQHAEPVLRSLAFGLLDLQGDSRTAPVGPYEANLENASKIRDDWQVGKPDAAATQALLRSAPPGEARGRLGRGRQAAERRASHPTRSGTPSLSGGNEMLIAEPGHRRRSTR